MFFAAKETWMLSSLVDYYYITSSKEAMDVLINVKEPHDKVCSGCPAALKFLKNPIFFSFAKIP